MDAVTKISAMLQTQTLPLPLKHAFQPMNALIALDSMKLFQVEVLIAMVVFMINNAELWGTDPSFTHDFCTPLDCGGGVIIALPNIDDIALPGLPNTDGNIIVAVEDPKV
jgi:hypothetical protein